MKKTDILFLADACAADILGDSSVYVDNVVIDSRAAREGSLFVCVIGEVNDGHNYVEKAYENGCRAFLMSRETVADMFSEAHPDACVVLADDTQKAFKQMASAYLSQFPVKRIGVTGSVGKTTTRMLVTAVLSEKFKTVCSEKNYNTHLGLCMTCFLADESTEAVVFEMGMDRPGEIAGYCEWIRPDVAVITNIGESHMEYLGSRSAIADAKLEITSFLKPGAPLFYIPDGEFLTKEEIRKRSYGEFSLHPVLEKGGDVQITSYEDKGRDGSDFTVRIGSVEQRMHLGLLGEHNVRNAALAAAVGNYYGISCPKIAHAFAGMSAFEGRLSAMDVGGILLIDDSYNASPASMLAALNILASMPADRHVAVISDMRELGPAEETGHYRVGQRAAELGIDLVIAAGANRDIYARGMADNGAEKRIIGCADAQQAAETALKLIHPGDAVLVKGSNSTRISLVAEEIRKEYSGK